MTIDLQTAQQRLAKAKEDVDFYANLIKLLSDPRIAGVSAPTYTPIEYVRPAATPSVFALENDIPMPPAKRSPRGEVRRKVYEALPDPNSYELTTAQIHDSICQKGYVFVSKHPIMAINDALAELQAENKAKLVRRQGTTNYWSKG